MAYRREGPWLRGSISHDVRPGQRQQKHGQRRSSFWGNRFTHGRRKCTVSGCSCSFTGSMFPSCGYKRQLMTSCAGCYFIQEVISCRCCFVGPQIAAILNQAIPLLHHFNYQDHSLLFHQSQTARPTDSNVRGFPGLCTFGVFLGNRVTKRSLNDLYWQQVKTAKLLDRLVKKRGIFTHVYFRVIRTSRYTALPGITLTIKRRSESFLSADLIVWPADLCDCWQNQLKKNKKLFYPSH